MDALNLGVPTWHAIYLFHPDGRGWRFVHGEEMTTAVAIWEAKRRRGTLRAKVYRDRLIGELSVWPARSYDLVHATGVAPGDLESEMEAEQAAEAAERRDKLVPPRRRELAGRSLAPISPTRW